jgi:hypothetical protein
MLYYAVLCYATTITATTTRFLLPLLLLLLILLICRMAMVYKPILISMQCLTTLLPLHYSTLLYCIKLHSTLLYYTTLHYTILYHYYIPYRYIITKGSFEKMAELCRPDSVPRDFVSQGRENAMQGGYVLGLARRELPPGLTPAGLEALGREAVEAVHTLELLALLIFRNGTVSLAVIQYRTG